MSFVSLPETASAQTPTVSKPNRKKKRRDPGQDATVIVDGSAVYQAPNFDAPVMEYLDRDRKVKISQRVYPGIGGLGTFYKIRLNKGVYGYITDVDIAISGVSGIENTKKQIQTGNKIEGDPLVIQKELEDPSGSMPDFGNTVYLTRFMGLSFSSTKYAETIAGSKEESNESFFGIKMSGPGTWLGGMPLDLEVQFLTSPPSFYDDISNSSSGFVINSHAFAMFPFLLDKPKQVLYYMFGPTLKYTAYDLVMGPQSAFPGKAVDSQEITLGLALGGGYAYRFSNKWALRVDATYTFEAESYMGFSGALQMRY